VQNFLLGMESEWGVLQGQSLYRKTSPLPLSSVERGKIDVNITGVINTSGSKEPSPEVKGAA